MRIVFIELYYELRFFYYFLSFIGFEVWYFKIIFLKKNKDNKFYLNQIESLKKRKILLINIIEEEKNGLIFENFDNDFTGKTFELNNQLLEDNIIRVLYKYFKANISKNKFEIYMRSILQANIQTQYQNLGSKINYWFNNNKNQKKNILCFANFANFFLKIDNKDIIKIYFPINIILFPINFLIKILNVFQKSEKKKSVFKKTNNQLNKLNINFNSKYLYVLHKSAMYGKLFEKKLFYYKNDKYLSEKEMSSVLYYKNNEGLFNLLEVSSINKIKYLFKSNLLFLSIVSKKISLENIAVAIMFSKIFFRFHAFKSNLKLFKNLRTVFIDWDTHCPKELLLVFEINKIKSICVQERSIQSSYKYFYNIICDTFLSSIPLMDKIFQEKPLSQVGQVIEFGNYREDYLFNDNYDDFIKEKYKINKKEKTIILYAHHTVDNLADQLNEFITNWDNHLYFMQSTYDILSKHKNIKVIYRFKDINWLYLEKFQNIINKIEENQNMFIDKEYSKSFFSYSLARFADIIIGPHSSILDELIDIGFKNVLLYDYGYKIESIIEKLKYKDTDFLCKNNVDLEKKFNEMLNKSESINFINNRVKQQVFHKEKLYKILKDQLKL